MNYLGHAVLAFGDPALLVGQFAGDFARGRTLDGWHGRVADGIRLHRFVDAWTDAHPEMRALRGHFSPARRRFAGIALDVAFDHHLARDWSTHCQPWVGRTLGGQAREVDRVLAASRSERWPEGLERLRLALVRERLIERWATREGVVATLSRIASRSSRLAPLHGIAGELEALDDVLASAIARVWPELVHACRIRVATLPSVSGSAAALAASAGANADTARIPSLRPEPLTP